MSSQRRLATVLFTDIVGSTERAAELGDHGWRDLLQRHHALVRLELQRFGGKELTTTGDGFLATFDRPEQAIRCACAARDAVRRLGVEIRAGLHAGEVEQVEKTVGGIAVHVGARVAALAGPGEVLVSSALRDFVAGAGFEFEERGVHALKGVPGEWRLYAVTSAPFRLPVASAWERVRRRSVLAGVVAFALLFGLAGVYVVVKDRGKNFAPSEAVADVAAPGIAVLPFAVRGEGLDVWREGMVDVLSTNLDGAGGFRAIDSRTVLARWDEGVGNATRPDLAASLDVARRTGARYAVIGSALATGPDVRFAAEIYDVESGANLGEAQAVGLPDSVLSLVNQLSIQVLRALPSATGGDVAWKAAASRSTASVPALKAYLEGEALYRRADFEGAAAGYRRALESDSTFALAAYRLGDAYGWMENIESDLAHEFLTRAGRNIARLPEREALLLRGVLILDAGSLDAFPLFEQAVRRYPDDAEAWFLLGDTYVHLGPQALVDWQKESARALSKAVELDPGFAPYYLHLIENAARSADTARTREILATMERLAPTTSDEVRAYGMAVSLTLGDSAQQSQAIAGLNSVDVQSVSIFTRLVSRSRLYPRLERAVEAWRARPDATPLAAYIAVLTDLIRGRVSRAADRLQDPLLDAEGRAHAAYRTHLIGLSAPSSWVEEALALPPAGAGFATFYAGAYAAEQGRWPDHAKAVARLRTEARQALAAGDTTGGGVTEATARALEGFGFLRKGDRESALQVLQAAQRQATGYGPPRHVNEIVRWWLGELLLEMDRPREAEPYFASLVFEIEEDPLAAQRLGSIYEALGEPAKAREAYEHFALAWQDADPELQPMVEKARAAAARLEGAAR